MNKRLATLLSKVNRTPADTENIQKIFTRIYEKGGVSAVCDEANLHPDSDITWEKCDACDDEGDGIFPALAGRCLVCGQPVDDGAEVADAKPTALTYITRVSCPEELDVSPDFATIDVSEELIATVKKDLAGLISIGCDQVSRYVGYVDWLPMIDGPLPKKDRELLNGATLYDAIDLGLEEVDDDEDESDFVSLAERRISVECCMLEVSRIGFQFTAFVKHTDVRISTSLIYFSSVKDLFA
jgi:hypothetical protein